MISHCVHSLQHYEHDNMKMNIVLLLFFCNVQIRLIIADRTIRRLNYKLDSDVTAIVGDNIINFELTRIESTAVMSVLEIETEQWVHDCCFSITSQPVLRIRLKQETNYPKITAYLRLRTPLSSIVMTGTGNLHSTNSLQSDSLIIELAGTSKAQIDVEISSKLEMIISGTAQMILSGHVKGTGYIRLTGAGEFDGRTCPMNTITVDVTGVGTAYVIGEQAVDIAVGSGVGHVFYHGPLRNQRMIGLGSVEVLPNNFLNNYRSGTIKEKHWHISCFLFSIILQVLIFCLF